MRLRGWSTRKSPGSQVCVGVERCPCFSQNCGPNSVPRRLPLTVTPAGNLERAGKVLKVQFGARRQLDHRVCAGCRERRDEAGAVGDRDESARRAPHRAGRRHEVPQFVVAQPSFAERHRRPRLGDRVRQTHDELGVRIQNDAVAVEREDLRGGVGTGFEPHRRVGCHRLRADALLGQMQPDPMLRIKLLNAESLVRRVVAIRDGERRRRRLRRQATAQVALDCESRVARPAVRREGA